MLPPAGIVLLVSYVPGQGLEQQFGGPASRSRSEVVDRGCTGLGVELETTVDQALIRGLVTAFRVCVSGLSSF